MEKELYNLSDFTMAVNGSIIDSENRLQGLEKNCSGNMQEYFDEILKKLGREVLLPDNNDLTNTIDKYWCAIKQDKFPEPFITHREENADTPKTE